MARYELEGEVWEIVQHGKELALVAGGKASTRRFISPDHAAIQFAKLIAEKETAGWKQVAATEPLAVSHFDEPREPELEHHIIADLDNRDAYSVYADWYQARNHPRGELIALQLAEDSRGEDRKLHDAVEKHLARYKTELLGPLARHQIGRESPFIWRNGFIQGLFFSGSERPAELIREVLAHPSGRWITSIELQIHDEQAIREALVAIAPAAPTLRDVFIMTGATLSGLELIEQLPQLRTLSLASLSDEPIRDLRPIANVAATCGGLHLRFDTASPNCERQLLPLFAREDLQIRKLSMRVPMHIDPILHALVDGPLAKQIEKLDIGLTNPDSGLRALITHRERFEKLEEVVVTVGRLTAEARAALKAHYKITNVEYDYLGDQIGYEPVHYDDVQE